MEFLLDEALSNSVAQSQILGLNFACVRSFHSIYIMPILDHNFLAKIKQ